MDHTNADGHPYFGSRFHTNGRGSAHATSQTQSSHASSSRDFSWPQPPSLPYQTRLEPEIYGPYDLEQLNDFDYTSFTPPNYDAAAASTSSRFKPVDSHPQYYFIDPKHPATMSLAYENRGFAEYPQSTIMDDPSQHDHMHHQQQRYHSPSVDMPNENPYTDIDASLELQIQELPQHKEDDEESGSPRGTTFAKPIRDILKDENGRFICTWAGCTEEIRDFNRKCEWSKHMDKHDRPYKCAMDGCEKIPGFTYSGGLLRHQREVHNLHGGPKKQLNCPHPNCKRHSGKGFSRQENLNEHLRRVHTASIDGEIQMPMQMPNLEEPEMEAVVRAGAKRKRTDRGEPTDVREDMARVIVENENLRRQVDMQSGQIAELMRQLSDVQAMLNPRMSQAPQAMMG